MNPTPVVIVLGAGIGGQGVIAAVAPHAHVVVADRSPELADAGAALATSTGGSGESSTLDLTDLDAVLWWRDELLRRHGRVDAVVHLVGGWQGSATVNADAIAKWRALLPGIVDTVQTTTVAFREALQSAPHGRYVMVTSTSVANPTKGNAAYASAKAAAETWVRALGSAFDGTPAAACIVAVKALVDPATRAANPDKTYPGYTDTTELGSAIAGLLTDAELDCVTYLNLTKAE